MIMTTKNIYREHTTANLLDLWIFMTNSVHNNTRWIQMNVDKIKSFGLHCNQAVILVRGGIISRRRCEQNRRLHEYCWVGPRPSIHMTNKLYEEMYKQYPYLLKDTIRPPEDEYVDKDPHEAQVRALPKASGVFISDAEIKLIGNAVLDSIADTMKRKANHISIVDSYDKVHKLTAEISTLASLAERIDNYETT